VSMNIARCAVVIYPNCLCTRTLLDAKKMDDGITCMAFTVSFVPNTGNKYFLAACDEHVRLYDFESCQV
jgi:hypothetical protein